MKTRRVVIRITLMMCIFIASCMSIYAAMDESEPNNTPRFANKINVGATVYGRSDWYDDYTDYFKFTAPLSGTAKLTVWADYSESDTGEVKAAVFDSRERELAYFQDEYSTESGTSATFPVICGQTYYIRCIGYDLNVPRDAEYHLKVGYSVGKTSITSAKRLKKAIKIKWNKKTGASFYQVQLTKKSTFDIYNWTRAKTVKVSAKSNNKTFNKLARNKKYCVRVRVARKINGKIYYSAWSKKKTIRTK